MTWIKICGITNLEDAKVAVEAGADALGFVFYENSLRSVDPGTAAEIARQMPPHIHKVGVFVNQPAGKIRDVTTAAGLTAAQVHMMDAGPERIQDLLLMNEPDAGLKLIAAFPADRLADDSWLVVGTAKKSLYALMLDSGSNSTPGGTGKTFDWDKARRALQSLGVNLPIIVAGGLTPNRVGEAIKIFRPWGVDVSSGVEVQPGKKDPEKVRAFITAVRHEDKTEKSV
jgi:phosphoribosylanthranilate isomerase